MTDQTNEEKEIEKQAKQLGERLAWLLAASSLPEDVKEAYITLVPEMEMEQIDALMQALEKHVADAAETEAESFVENLKTIKDNHNKKQKYLEEKALAEMDDIERILKQAEEI
jgi:hypothetical protein